MLLLGAPGTASAWHRGHVEIFAVVPDLPGNVPAGIEGLAVGPDGTVYTPSAGFNSEGPVSGPPHLFSFKPDGELLHNVALVSPGTTTCPSSGTQPSPALLGLVYQSSSKTLLIADLFQGIVWQASPTTGQACVFMITPFKSASGLNALTFDKKGNVYVSDSFQGVIWKTGPTGGTPTVFVDSDTLSPAAATGVILVPPFGANGVEFNNEYTEMYVANTAYHSIVEVPVTLNTDGSVSATGTAAVLTTGINAPDGIAVDSKDNLWVDSNQGDEIIVIDPTATNALGEPQAKVIAKRGDFHGISDDGTIQGLLFPASPAFSPDGKYIYTSNFGLYLPYAGVPETAVDSPWTLKVKHYTIAKIRAEIPPLGDNDDHHHHHEH
ncbi:MAG TPA: SMP-30/gluconolactonase/LRE family protein [Stellaceae bacterium]|nr:SMP-30/gluconolactonase/LRE family protein [Stellaceae bacterium]